MSTLRRGDRAFFAIIGCELSVKLHLRCISALFEAEYCPNTEDALEKQSQVPNNVLK